jgi:glutathione peroxidase
VETTTLPDIPLLTIAGEPATLADHAGNVLLVVNVASRCGLTPQYEGLERLHETYGGQGFEVLGFPANDFGAQEPGTNEEIVEFCTTQYSVAFPMFAKIVVTGKDKHPLYDALTSAAPRAQGDPDAYRERLRGFGLNPTDEPEVLWNFEKFLLDRTGQVVGRFAPTMKPEDPTILAAVERELAR